MAWCFSSTLVTTQLVCAAYREFHDIEHLPTVTREDVEEVLARQQRQYLSYSNKVVSSQLAAQLKAKYFAQVAELSAYRNEDFAAIMGHCALSVLFGYMGGQIAVFYFQRNEKARPA
jgi:hypothetical protein